MPLPDPYDASDVDPFAGGVKIPSLSWRALPIGSVFTLRVTECAKLLHGKNFKTNLPDYWDEAKTEKKMSAVINVEVLAGPHSVGELRSVWAQKPSDLFVAIAAAQAIAGAKIAPGGTLHLKFVGETPHADPKNNPIKNYAAKYVPPVVADAFATPPAGQTEARRISPTPDPGVRPLAW